MRAAVFHGRGDIRIEERPTPVLGRDDLLLKITAVGICGTDAKEFDSGPHMFPIQETDPVTGHVGPMIPGHEFVGWVEAVGEDVDGFAVGALVVSGAGISCGACHWCRRGRTNLCERYATVGLERDGALAEHAAVPASTCIDVSELGLSSDALALAQPMSIAVHSMRRGRLEPHDLAVVIGAGGIGAFLVFAAASLGATVVVADLDAGRLEVAATLGARHTVDVAGAASVASLLGAEGLVPSVVYEVTGTPAGLGSALGLLARGSRLVQIGHQPAPREIDVPALTLHEHELIGTNAHQFRLDLPEALRLLASRSSGWSDVAPLALPLEALPGELESLANGRTGRIKTLIDPWAGDPRSTRT